MAASPATPVQFEAVSTSLTSTPPWQDDDEEAIEMPDFHYDWFQGAEDKMDTVPTSRPADVVRDKAQASLRHQALFGSHQSISSSITSSASSSRQLSSADHSISSATSLPTPPSEISSTLSRKPALPLSVATTLDDSDADGSFKLHAIRPTQRVVSAPVMGNADGHAKNLDDRNRTETMSTRASVRTTYNTPGLSQRTLASSTASGPRIAGLSRFGGPARRGKMLDENDEDEDALALIAESPRYSEPDSPVSGAHDTATSQSATIRANRPREEERQPSSPPPLTSTGRENRQPEAAYEQPKGKSRGVTEQQEPPHRSSSEWGGQHGDSRRDAHPVMRASRPAPTPAAESHRFEAPPSGRMQYQSEAAPAQQITAPPPQKRLFAVNGVAYERLGVLGKGGSSKVYSVLCPTKRVVYALKRVGLDRADAETYQSYTNEIELLKRLRGHDRIIQLIDHQITFNQGNRPKILMMVMECGEIDFAALLDEQRGKPLNMNFVGLYWQQMLEAVQAVHAENVVHTDLKPANFVLVKGRLKIIDFGIAKAVANDTVNIQRDQQIGTVNYMSPEAIQRMNNQKVLKLSYPSDVWSLGCILYQMIYGSPPFQYINGGPLPKMNAIADPSHRIDYPSKAVCRPMAADARPIAVIIPVAAVASMRSCLNYNKDHRLTIPQLLEHEFLSPSRSALAPDATSITPDQMAMLVNFIRKESGLGPLSPRDSTAKDLFTQLQEQNGEA